MTKQKPHRSDLREENIVGVQRPVKAPVEMLHRENGIIRKTGWRAIKLDR